MPETTLQDIVGDYSKASAQQGVDLGNVGKSIVQGGVSIADQQLNMHRLAFQQVQAQQDYNLRQQQLKVATATSANQSLSQALTEDDPALRKFRLDQYNQNYTPLGYGLPDNMSDVLGKSDKARQQYILNMTRIKAQSAPGQPLSPTDQWLNANQDMIRENALNTPGFFKQNLEQEQQLQKQVGQVQSAQALTGAKTTGAGILKLLPDIPADQLPHVMNGLRSGDMSDPNIAAALEAAAQVQQQRKQQELTNKTATATAATSNAESNRMNAITKQQDLKIKALNAGLQVNKAESTVVTKAYSMVSKEEDALNQTNSFRAMLTPNKQGVVPQIAANIMQTGLEKAIVPGLRLNNQIIASGQFKNRYATVQNWLAQWNSSGRPSDAAVPPGIIDDYKNLLDQVQTAAKQNVQRSAGNFLNSQASAGVIRKDHASKVMDTLLNGRGDELYKDPDVVSSLQQQAQGGDRQAQMMQLRQRYMGYLNDPRLQKLDPNARAKAQSALQFKFQQESGGTPW